MTPLAAVSPPCHATPDVHDVSADTTLRAAVGSLPAPEFEPHATPLVQPLSESTVAIVTTAGLKSNGEVELW